MNRCRSGDRCNLPAQKGEKFCKAHLEQLRRVAAGMKEKRFNGTVVPDPTTYTVRRLPGVEPPKPKHLVYSQAQLSTLATAQFNRADVMKRSRRWDSNPQPAVYKTAALPIELRRQGDSRRSDADGKYRNRPLVCQAKSGRSGL